MVTYYIIQKWVEKISYFGSIDIITGNFQYNNINQIIFFQSKCRFIRHYLTYYCIKKYLNVPGMSS